MRFDFQPVLEGELVSLRPLRADDFDSLYAVASDPLIWEQHPCRDRHEEPVFREFFRESLESGGALVARDSRDQRVIGSSRFHGHDSFASEVEIGWTFLARSHWGGAFNGEMKALMLRHAFRFVNRVVFLVGPHNARSQRALEKIGAVRAGEPGVRAHCRKSRDGAFRSRDAGGPLVGFPEGSGLVYRVSRVYSFRADSSQLLEMSMGMFSSSALFAIWITSCSRSTNAVTSGF